MSEFAIAALLVALLLLWPRLAPWYLRLAAQPRWCFALVGLLPVALRLALLPVHCVPVPAGADDYSYLLLGDTLAHFRFANAVHPMHRFFEAVFVLQEPSYSSIFPMGQGIALAFGQLLFGIPWAGVLLSMGAFCALCYWMLRGWVAPEWALAGGLLAGCIFGPLSQWTNTYWGGGVAAIGGCLAFGALPRRNGWLLGIGIAIQILTRPFEALLVVAAIAVYRRPPLLAGVPILIALGLTGLHNHAVTGGWTTLPYMESRYQYGVPAAFTFQANPVPHRALTAEQQLDYRAQSVIHDTAHPWDRAKYYRFFFIAPLYLALPAFLWRARERRYAWVLGTVMLLALGTGFYPYFYPHYIAAASCLFVLMAVVSLETIPRRAAHIVLVVCAAHFLFYYGTEFGTSEPANQFAKMSGRRLIFVRYSPAHRFREWIHNAADIDSAQTVWAADLGETENAKLRAYYPGRPAWIFEPDAHPPKLTSMAVTP